MMLDEKDFLRDGILRAQAHARAVVADQFITGMNPRFRGPNWEWESFKNIATRMAVATSHQGFSDEEWQAWEDDIDDAVRTTARIESDRVLRRSGVLSWWSDEIDHLQRKGES